MREEVSTVYQDFRQRWPRVKIHFWQGKPFELDDLERVAVRAAKHILVLGASRNPRVADSLVISTLCALRCLPLEQPQAAATHALSTSGDEGEGAADGAAAAAQHARAAREVEVICEISLPQNLLVARRLGGGLCRTVTAKTAIDELLAICTLTPAVGHPLIELMSAEGSQFSFVDAHRLFASTNAASERAKGQPWTVGALRHRLPKAILLGIVHETPTAPAAAAGRAAPHPGSATTAAIAAAAGSSAALSASAPTSASSRGNRGSMLGWRPNRRPGRGRGGSAAGQASPRDRLARAFKSCYTLDVTATQSSKLPAAAAAAPGVSVTPGTPGGGGPGPRLLQRELRTRMHFGARRCPSLHPSQAARPRRACSSLSQELPMRTTIHHAEPLTTLPAAGRSSSCCCCARVCVSMRASLPSSASGRSHCPAPRSPHRRREFLPRRQHPERADTPTPLGAACPACPWITRVQPPRAPDRIGGRHAIATHSAGGRLVE